MTRALDDGLGVELREDGTLPRIPPGPELGIAAFACGVLALLSSPLLLGVPLGGGGLVMSALQLRRSREARGWALWGAGLSMLGFLASLAASGLYVRLYRELRSRPRTVAERPAGTWDRWLGRPAPPLTVTTLRGETVDLASLKGKQVVVDFWATWCGPCVKEIPDLDRLARESVEKVVVVAITDESRADVERFAGTHAMSYHVVPELSDDSLAEPFNRVSSIPTMFFIDADGVIRSVRVGYHDHDALEARLWTSGAAERWVRGARDEALALAARTLEADLSASTEADLAAVFGGDAAYRALHERVKERVLGLFEHYEKSHGRRFDRNRASAAWVIWSLGAEHKDARAVPLLARYLRESSFDDARWRAADALWLIGDRRAVPHLLAALADPSPRVAGFAASGLGDLGDASAAEALLELFERLPDNREEAKARAADALGKLGDARAIAPLSASLAEIRDPAYVRWAEPALRRLEAGARR